MKLRFPLSEISLWSSLYRYARNDKELIRIRQKIQNRGFLNKSEFHSVCNWKSPRSAGHAKNNEDGFVEEITAFALAAKSERARIEVLTILNGASWPLTLRHDRPGDPSHIEAEVVESPEEDVGGNRSVFNTAEKFLGLSLDKDLWQQRLDRLVLGKGGPAFEVGTCFHLEVGLKGISPRAGCNTGIATCQIGPGDLQVEHRLTHGRVLVLNNLLSLIG